MTRVGILVSAVAAASLAACRSAPEPGPASPAPAAARDTGGLGAPKIPWPDKTREERLEYMGLFVLPAMEELFAGWRPDEYGDKGAFRCQSCHGEGFDTPAIDFHMPRVAFPLDPADPMGVAMRYDAEAATFMAERVVPEMARLLGEEPFVAETGRGTFGCFRCHPRKGEKVP
jgi:hypothetical protein